jgi:hypothetical protein
MHWPRLLVAVSTAACNHNSMSYYRAMADAEIDIFSYEDWPPNLGEASCWPGCHAWTIPAGDEMPPNCSIKR